jgi:hypothetical protein
MNHYNHEMPHWARRIDDNGVRRWHKDRSLTARRGEYVWAVIWNFIFLWILSKLPEWKLGFITDSFGAVVWILTLNIYVQIGGNLLMLVFDHRIVRYLARIVTEASGFVTLLALFYIFPFDFSNFHGLFWLDWALPVIFVISMVVSGLKVLSNIWKLIFWRS